MPCNRLFRRGRGALDKAAPEAVAQFVGVFEPLDQPIAQSIIRRLGLVVRHALAQAHRWH
jgi:hypothetical protein